MDLQITKLINHFGAGTVIDNVSIFISWVLFLVVLWIVILLLIITKDKKNRIIVISTLIIAIIIHFLITEYLLKQIIAVNFHMFRERPWQAHPNDIIALGKHYVDTSFPSGHMASTATILTVLFYYYRKYWAWMVFFIFTLAFSRIHNGMHYFTDVIAGVFIGIICALLAIKITKNSVGIAKSN